MLFGIGNVFNHRSCPVWGGTTEVSQRPKSIHDRSLVELIVREERAKEKEKIIGLRSISKTPGVRTAMQGFFIPSEELEFNIDRKEIHFDSVLISGEYHFGEGLSLSKMLVKDIVEVGKKQVDGKFEDQSNEFKE